MTEPAQQAASILRRTPIDLTRRASYGWERRAEQVVLHWPDGRRIVLTQAADDRISFALRDHYEAPAPPCREQVRHLVARFGTPSSVVVSWRYEAEWEGEAPLDAEGRVRFEWAEAAELLRDVGGDCGLPPE